MSTIEALRSRPPLVIFKDEIERDEFIDYLCANYTHSDVEQQYGNISDFNSSSKEVDIQQIKLCRLITEELPKWRELQESEFLLNHVV